MKYQIFILIFITAWVPASVSSLIDTFVQKETVVKFSEDDILINNENCIDLSQAKVVNQQFDSILIKITKNINKESNMCFYITFMTLDSVLYFEIFEDYPNNYLFEIINNRDTLYQRMNRKIYGYLKYNDIDIYLLLYPYPYEPSKDVLDELVCKPECRVIINRKPQMYFFQAENPMWLYRFSGKRVDLLKSINDKGFFTNP